MPVLAGRQGEHSLTLRSHLRHIFSLSRFIRVLHGSSRSGYLKSSMSWRHRGRSGAMHALATSVFLGMLSIGSRQIMRGELI